MRIQDRTAPSLINTAALHADQTVLNDIKNTDAVLAAQLVQLLDQGNGLVFSPSTAVGTPFSKWMVT